MRILFLLFALSAQALDYQLDFTGVNFTCKADADCSPLTYIDCCPQTRCVNKRKTKAKKQVRLVCSEKIDCKRQAEERAFDRCACVAGSCRTTLKDKTVLPPPKDPGKQPN